MFTASYAPRKYFHTWQVSRIYGVVKETRVFLGQREPSDSRKTRFLWKSTDDRVRRFRSSVGITVKQRKHPATGIVERECFSPPRKTWYTECVLFFFSFWNDHLSETRVIIVYLGIIFPFVEEIKNIMWSGFVTLFLFHGQKQRRIKQFTRRLNWSSMRRIKEKRKC